MRKILLCFIVALLVATGCVEDTVVEENIEEKNEMRLFINETLLAVKWEENETVTALSKLVQEEPLTINMKQYGGFEQVGKFPKNITANDEQMVTEPGDIVLYSGNSLVIFYGSNTWAYTKVGHIEGVTTEELENILSDNQITVTLSLLSE